MNPALQEYATRDAGYRQFCDRYETVSADPETRRNYVLWFKEMLREEGMIDAVRQEYEPRLVEAEQKRMKAEQKRMDAEQKRMDAEQKRMDAEQKRLVDLAEAEQKRLVDLAEAEQKHKDEMLTAAKALKNAGISTEIIISTYHLSKEEVASI